MPSPKAVLRDIHDLDLDPSERHLTTRDGRLGKEVTPLPVPVQPGPVQLELEEKPKAHEEVELPASPPALQPLPLVAKEPPQPSRPAVTTQVAEAPKKQRPPPFKKKVAPEGSPKDPSSAS